MERAKKLLKNFAKTIFTHDDVRIKLFNVLALGGSITSFFVCLFDLFYNSLISAFINAILFFLSVSLLAYSQKTGKYQLCYLLTIVSIFFIGFPILFFMNGGYQGGMPSFFVFAILFTVLMLDKEYARIVALLEFIIYISLFIFAYYYPKTIIYFETDFNLMIDVLIGFSLSATVCGICLYLHLREYEAQKEILAKQNEQLKIYNDAKTSFLTTVAHEIRNPLTAISANARDAKEILYDEHDKEEEELVQNNLDTVEKIVFRIDRILTDLMDTVSIEQGKFKITKASIQLEDILYESAQSFAVDIKNTHNTIEYKINPLPPILADHDRLLQVMTNLLSNSIKYTRNGTISICLYEEKGFQVVRVKDTGEGMAKKIQSDVFKGYVSMSKEYWRHGIGLYVCHQIITAHGGVIAVESEEGEGTQITFKLPMTTVAK